MSEVSLINTNDYASLQKMLGMTYDAKTTSSGSKLARLSVNKKPLYGETTVNGKVVKVEMLSGGFTLRNGSTVYAESAVIRPFAQRFMHQRYDAAKSNYVKTLLADSLDMDLKDNTGSFNCGKSSEYIEDFQALSKAEQDFLRSVKRTRVIYGEITMENAITKEGDAHPVENVPFVWDVDTKEGFKNMGNVWSKLVKMKHVPMQHTVTLTTEARDLPTGASYYVPMCELDVQSDLPFEEKDNDLLIYFFNNIESHNKWVSDEWEKNNKSDPSISGDYVNVEEATLDE